MRARLFVVFLVPLVGVLLALGGAYAWSAARSVQQEFYAERLGDLSYFVTSARQALRSGNGAVIEGEVERYHELYGARVAVIDRSGTPWVSSGFDSKALDEESSERVFLALSGRRGETPGAVLPWLFTEAVMVEPVFNDGDVIGAVLLSTSMDAPRATITRQWVLLVLVSVASIAAGLLIVNRLASWVLQPLRRVDEAMEEIEKGHMEARIADDTGPPELRRMIRLFNRMAEEIERVVSRQQEFALNASHELRNPLNALLVRVEYLATGLPEDWEGDIEATREEGRRMAQILDALLGLARSGQEGGSFGEVDLAELAERRVAAWSEVAAQKRVFFTVRTGRRMLATTDAIIVESAFDAVVDNAVKYSPSGSRIEVSVEEFDGGSEIVVRDHGPGIDEEELERMTDRFWRGERTRDKPGTGLGLAIASDLLASAGGQLRVETVEPRGLRVTLRFTAGSAGVPVAAGVTGAAGDAR